VCVLGTRPEAIKLAPIVTAARARPERFSATIVATGQHREMAAAALAAFGLEADIDLDIMAANQRPTDVLARVLQALPPVVERADADVVLVQGDTSSTLAGALCAHHARIPVGHVEAGLRTADRYTPFPEEMNRRLTSTLATHHFAPTAGARDRLLAEGIPASAIVMTGNTVVDALTCLRGRARAPRGVALPADAPVILLTAHRRENHGVNLEHICAAVRDLARAKPGLAIVCPVHPHPNVRGRMHGELGRVPGVQLIDPVDYQELLWLLDRCTIVLTDSGGLQEEAPTYRKPVLVLRDVTERPEGIEAGVARLVGTGRAAIVAETLRLLDDPAEYRRMAGGINPYGDGRAAERILDALDRSLPGPSDHAPLGAAAAGR
jgi:UDP-N-acetylglucosamine 2-epimerase (non-hydrolysing)